MNALSRLALMVALLVPAAAAQDVVVSLVTDKEVYEYGETIELQYTVANEGDEQFFIWVAPYCSATFTWGSLSHPGENGACALATVPYFFPPGSMRVWTWHLAPAEVSMPETDGLQTVSAGSSIWYGTPSGEHVPPDLTVGASTTFIAPQYLGGRMCVQLAEGLTLDDVADVMEDLNAEVIEPDMSPPAFCHVHDPPPYIWQIEGTTVADAIQQYAADERFLSMVIFRATVYDVQFILSTEPGGELVNAGLSAAFPNPASSSVRLELLPPSSGPVVVELLDLHGRRVALMHEGSLQAGQMVTINLDAPRLAAGSYVVRAVGEGFTFSQPVTIVR